MDHSPPGFSVHGILQARILEWVAVSFSRGSSLPRDQTWVSCVAGGYAEYIMQNAGLDEAQAGIKTAMININSLRYADDTTLMAETEEELKSLLMKVKEESEKAGLTLNTEKTKIISPDPIT